MAEPRYLADGVAGRQCLIKVAHPPDLTLAESRQVIAVRERSSPPCRHVTVLLDTHTADFDRRTVELTALYEDTRRLRRGANSLDPAR